MGQIYGSIIIDCNFNKTITDAQFRKFKSDLDKTISDWDFAVYDLAEKHGFRSEDMHPLMLDDLTYEKNNEE